MSFLSPNLHHFNTNPESLIPFLSLSFLFSTQNKILLQITLNSKNKKSQYILRLHVVKGFKYPNFVCEHN